MLFLESRRSVITWASLCPWEGPVEPRGWPETSSRTRKDILADIPGETQDQKSHRLLHESVTHVLTSSLENRGGMFER